MTPQQEADFERRSEAHFKGQRELQPGRNFLWNTMRFHDGKVKDAYDIGICRTFPKAPGSRLCGACVVEGCDMRQERSA